MTDEIYDARGNGEGTTRPTITGDHENRITDYTAVVVSRTPTKPDSFVTEETHGIPENHRSADG